MCLLTISKMLLPRFRASHIMVGEEIGFAIPAGDAVGTEICISKASSSGGKHCLYHAPIGHVTQPRPNKGNQDLVSAEVLRGGLGITAVHLPCEVLRDYFSRVHPRALSSHHLPYPWQRTPVPSPHMP